MGILSKVSFATLIRIGVVELASVILVCYGLAVKEGHVKPWLPTISDCGVYPPEVFVFRYGLVVCAVLLAVEAVAFYDADKPFSKSKTCLVLGLVVAFCLGVVGVVNDQEVPPVHDAAAVTLFVCQDILMFLITFYSIGSISYTSLASKIVCTMVSSIATIARLMITHDPGLFPDSGNLLAEVEWTNTIVLLMFQLSLSGDFPGYYIAEAKESGKKETSTEEKVKLLESVL